MAVNYPNNILISFSRDELNEVHKALAASYNARGDSKCFDSVMAQIEDGLYWYYSEEMSRSYKREKGNG